MHNMRLLYPALLCLQLLYPAGETSAAGQRVDRVERLIVKYKQPSDQNSQISSARVSLQHARGKLRRSKHQTGNKADIYYLDRPRSTAEAQSIARELMLRTDIEYAEPDYRRYASLHPDDPDYYGFLPNDPGYVSQWYLYDTAGGLHIQHAWPLGNTSDVIAVIDTGMLSHEDIASGRVLSGYDFISDVDAANDGNGRDSNPDDAGDFVTEAESTTIGGPFEDCEIRDSSWHGTMVGGLIIAENNNQLGIAGLARRASLLPLRALGKCGGLTSDIADAILWAAGIHIDGIPDNENPADVINLSLGSQDGCSITEQSAIDAAVAAGSVVVAAAGNDGVEGISSPANCNNVIAVAATTREGGETCYTNIGPNVDLGAPGGNDDSGVCEGAEPDDFILTTGNDGTTTSNSDDYYYVIGTSFAAPLVSGTVAIMKATDPTLLPAEIEEILKRTARTFPAGTNDGFGDCTTTRCGAGLLDAHGAIVAAADIDHRDLVPDPYTLNTRRNVGRDRIYESNPITVTGIDTAIAINVLGDEDTAYSIDGGPFVDTPGTISVNQTVVVRLRSSNDYNSRTDGTLYLGDDLRSTFTLFTEKRPGAKFPSGGSGGGETGWLLPLCIALLLRKRITFDPRAEY
jgi:serine protease